MTAKKSSHVPGEVEMLFQQHGVSEKQYVIWAWQRFRNQAFGSGLVIGLLFVAPILWGAYLAYQEGDTQGFWGMIVAAIFVALIFIVSAFWMKNGGPQYRSEGIGPFFYTPAKFESIDVVRRTSPQYVKKLKAHHWEAVQRIDVQAFEAKEKTKNPGMREGVTPEKVDRVKALKLKMKKIGLIGAAFFAVALITFPLYLIPLVGDSVWRFVTMGILGIIFFATTIGLHLWLFLYGYEGYLKREIILYASYTWDDTTHHGKWADLFAVVAMCAAVLSFAAFMFIPIGLLMGWE